MIIVGVSMTARYGRVMFREVQSPHIDIRISALPILQSQNPKSRKAFGVDISAVRSLVFERTPKSFMATTMKDSSHHTKICFRQLNAGINGILMKSNGALRLVNINHTTSKIHFFSLPAVTARVEALCSISTRLNRKPTGDQRYAP